MGMIEELKKRIDEVDVVSFDIFDTLIVRLYRKPTDLFAHLEESTGFSGFKQARVLAEQEARNDALKKDVHEITLDEIYEYIHPSYRNLVEKEIEMECLMCKANPEMLEIFHYAIARKKRVFISSDMYLPKEVIERILNNNGYRGYEKLLLSSSTLRPKATGEMYEDLITQSGVDPRRILHIGDNFLTDYEVAKKNGIESWYYEPIQETYGDDLNSAFFACVNHRANTDIALSMLKMVTAIDEYKTNRSYWERFGFKYIGIIAYAYVRWLKSRFDAEQINRAFFMLRDGYIFKRVFDALYPDFITEEIYGSRRLYLFAGASTYDDIRFHLIDIHVKGITYRQFWDRLAVNDTILYTAFARKFPYLDNVIHNDEDLSEIDEFFKDHFCDIKEIGQRERELLGKYFQGISLGSEKTAIIDLGWKCSMLRGVEKICALLGCHVDMTGFYLGTHSCNTAKLRVESYLLDHGESTGAENSFALKNYGFVIPVLELAFSAPHPSVLKIEERDGEVRPVYQDAPPRELERIKISEQILKGVMDYISEMEEIQRVFPFEISKEAALTPLEYFATNVSRVDEHELEKVFCFPGIGNEQFCYPITKTGCSSFAVVNPWPGDESAEYEVIERMKRASKEIGVKMTVVDNYGHILDEKQKATNQLIDPKSVDFVITTHYESHKTIDAFYYHALWNPPEIPLNTEYYVDRVVNQYEMNDDFLTYDFGGMKNHLQAVLIDKPRNLENCSCLTASFPMSAMLPPRLENPTMFYCGMNWEKVTGDANRHEGLFKLLDRTKKVKFYGPETVKAWGGIRPWEGYDCYQHSIPFDGFSILKEINECGICLVLSSDIHRRAAAVTNRLYEACAAGAVIISDDNEFMLRYFKDAALFITYNKNDPDDTFRQIMDRYEWIVSHPNEAAELAQRAQDVFRDKFALDSQLRTLINRHGERVDQIAKDLFAKETIGRVLVTFVLDTRDTTTIQQKLNAVFYNIQNQNYPNIVLAIAADDAVFDFVKVYCEDRCANAKPIRVNLFDSKGVRAMTDGQAIRKLQKTLSHKYFINTSEKEVWFYDHLTTLIRTIEDHESVCAYSGVTREDCNRFRHTFFYSSLKGNQLYNGIPNSCALPVAGQFIFTAEADKYVPDFLFDSIDGKEHYAYAALLHYKYKKQLSFSHRMTLVYRQDDMPNGNRVLDDVRESRFIQGLVRFDLPEVAESLNSISSTRTQVSGSETMGISVGQAMLILPLKNLLRLRYYKFWMFRLKPESAQYKKYEQKYNAVLAEYNQFWGI